MSDIFFLVKLHRIIVHALCNRNKGKITEKFYTKKIEYVEKDTVPWLAFVESY